VIVALPFVFFLCSYFLALDASDKKDEEFVEGFSEDPGKVNCAAACDLDPSSADCIECTKKEGFMGDFCKEFPDDEACNE
tara:strand:- start:79760 stop:79999 length:240 start_codon:yes stop_codon:yes gene_type:complete